MQAAGSGDSDALLATTRCEETLFPWDRNADPATRARQATAAAGALAPATVRPFDRSVALRGELIPLCVGWPVASPAPAATRAAAAGPDARARGPGRPADPARGRPGRRRRRSRGATVVAIPHTGHSVLGSDLSTCGKDAVTAFFAGQQPAPCAPTQNLFFPTPVAPTKLSRVPGRNRTIKTVNAVAETLDDVRRHFIGDAVAAGHTPRAGSRVGGLRSGYARFTNSGILLKHIAYVPRIAVSGLYRLGDHELDDGDRLRPRRARTAGSRSTPTAAPPAGSAATR